MSSAKPLRKRKTSKNKVGRPALGGEVVFVRVHGEVQAKVKRTAAEEGVGKPEAARRLIMRAP
jgi:hypothetical protein